MTTAQIILVLLDTLLALSARIPAIRSHFQDIREAIGELKAEGRDPTDAEWETVGQSIDAKIARRGRAGPPTPRA